MVKRCNGTFMSEHIHSHMIDQYCERLVECEFLDESKKRTYFYLAVLYSEAVIAHFGCADALFNENKVAPIVDVVLNDLLQSDENSEVQ